MIVFENYKDVVEKNLHNFRSYTNFKYVIGKNSFSRKSKWSYMDYLLFIMCNKGKTTTLEIEFFVEEYYNDDDAKLIKKQSLSDARSKINPIIFKDVNKDLVCNLFKSKTYSPFFKGKNVFFLVDGSKSEIYNCKQTLEEFDVPENTEKYTQPARTLFSTFIEAGNNFVLDSILAKARANERNLLKEHIETIKELCGFN